MADNKTKRSYSVKVNNELAKSAIDDLNQRLLRQYEIESRVTGQVLIDTRNRIKELKELIKAKEAEIDVDKKAEEAAKKRAETEKKIAEQRARQEQLRVKRAAINKRRENENFWMNKPTLGSYMKRRLSPLERWQDTLAEQRAQEDYYTRLSEEGETEAIREDAAKKAQAAKEAGSVTAKNLGKAAVAAQVVGTIVKGVNTVLKHFSQMTGISLTIKDAFTDIERTVASMTDMYKGMATYSANSLTVNQEARTTMQRYGLTGAQAYGFNQARSLLGVQSDEDFLYMTSTQRNLFGQYMSKQTEWYNRLEQSGVLKDIQTMQMDLALFKQEMAADLLQWIAENKETFTNAAKFLVNAVKVIVQILSKLFTLFGVDYSENVYGSTSTAMSDLAANNSSYRTTNRSVNVKMTNNVNGLFNQKEMEDFLNTKLESAARSAAVAMGG